MGDALRAIVQQGTAARGYRDNANEAGAVHGEEKHRSVCDYFSDLDLVDEMNRPYRPE